MEEMTREEGKNAREKAERVNTKKGEEHPTMR
jgi:hypothetical protein